MKKEKNDSRIRSVLIISAAVAVLAAVVLFIVFNGNYKNFPAAIHSLFSDKEQKNEVIPGDEGKIYESLMELATYDDIQVTKGLSADDALGIIKNLNEAESYHCNFTVNRYSDNETLKKTSEIWKNADNYRISVGEKNSDSLIIHNGDKTYFNTENGTRTVNGGDFSVAAEAGFMDIQELAASLEKDTVETSCSIINDKSNSRNILYVEYTDSESNIREIAYILIDAGLIVRAESYFEDELYFSEEASEISYGINIPDSYFEF